MTSRACSALIGAVAAMPSISLPEVLALAELQVRIDRKYLVDLRTFVELAARLDGFAVLDIDGRRSFDYESAYFDSPDLALYRQHLQGRRRRYKVRTRAYLNSGECAFEVKLKGGRSETVKARMPYPLEDRDRLTGGARAFLAERLHQEYGAGPAPDLRRALTTSYHRTTLVDTTGRSRLTCDVDLFFHRGDRTVPGPPDLVLVESKTAGRAGPADRILRDLGARPVGVSKYCLAVALLNPGLRANPWHRTLKLFR